VRAGKCLLRNFAVTLPAGFHGRGPLTFDMSDAQAGKTRRSRPMEGLGVIALQDGVFLLVGKDLLSHIVDHHGTFEVAYGWISAVLLSDE